MVSHVKNSSKENMINCIMIDQDIQFCVKCGENHISSCALQRKKVQSSLWLESIFVPL